MTQLFLACALILGVSGGMAAAADDQCHQDDLKCQQEDVSSQTVSLLQKQMGLSKTISSEPSPDFTATLNVSSETVSLLEKQMGLSEHSPRYTASGYEHKVALMDGPGCTAPYMDITSEWLCWYAYEKLSYDAGITSQPGSHYVVLPRVPPHHSFQESLKWWTPKSKPWSWNGVTQNWPKGCSYGKVENRLTLAGREPPATKTIFCHHNDCCGWGTNPGGRCLTKEVPNEVSNSNPSICLCTTKGQPRGFVCPDGKVRAGR